VSYCAAMSTLAEIEDAVMALPPEEQQVLLGLLSGRLRQGAPVETGRTLNPEKYPALKGLPPDLSIGTGKRVREFLAKRHAANR
jgi:hypothetical protein